MNLQKTASKRPARKSRKNRNPAELLTTSSVSAARAIAAIEGQSVTELVGGEDALAAVLSDKAKAVSAGDMRSTEAMLFLEAQALQSLFVRLTERAMAAEHVAPFESNMKFALRAQAQCRATLETLAVIRNPPVVYARQANFAAGHQQVNNACAHAGNSNPAANELSGAQAHELPAISRAPAATIPAYSRMAPVGTFDWPKVPRR